MKKTTRVPLREQLRAWVQRGIRQGNFPEGTPVPSINVLMGKFGVARETVRQALEDLVRQGVLTPQQGRGFFVTSRRRRILRVALVARVDGIYVAPIYRGLVRELGNAATVLVVDPQDNATSLRNLAESLAYSHHIDRLLLIPPRGREKDFAVAIEPFRRSFGMAWIDRAPAGTRDACFLPDYPACVGLAVNHFHALGIRDIFYFGRSPEDSSVYSVMRRAFAERIPFRRRRAAFLKSWEQTARVIRGTGRKTLGILAENYVEALHLMTHLAATGVRVPEDAAIISCDNSKWTDEVCPAISSVDPGFEELGMLAAQWIMRESPRPDAGDEKLVRFAQPKLVMKESTPPGT